MFIFKEKMFNLKKLKAADMDMQLVILNYPQVRINDFFKILGKSFFEIYRKHQADVFEAFGFCSTKSRSGLNGWFLIWGDDEFGWAYRVTDIGNPEFV